jgi:hypothetical protein
VATGGAIAKPRAPAEAEPAPGTSRRRSIGRQPLSPRTAAIAEACSRVAGAPAFPPKHKPRAPQFVKQHFEVGAISERRLNSMAGKCRHAPSFFIAPPPKEDFLFCYFVLFH